MGFRLVVNRLVAIGYPEAILEFEYDHSFPVRSVGFLVCLYLGMFFFVFCFSGFVLLTDIASYEFFCSRLKTHLFRHFLPRDFLYCLQSDLHHFSTLLIIFVVYLSICWLKSLNISGLTFVTRMTKGSSVGSTLFVRNFLAIQNIQLVIFCRVLQKNTAKLMHPNFHVAESLFVVKCSAVSD